MAEDPQLLGRHNFIPVENPQQTIFGRSGLAISSSPPGSHFLGGFEDFQMVARALRKQIVGPLLPEPDSAAVPDPAPAGPSGKWTHTDNPPPPPSDPVFKADGRIVEVYTTVTDSRGRYVDDLDAGQFSVLEQGNSKPVLAFENRNAPVSVALLFDTTGSMANTLPLLKAAAMQLVDDLRPADSVAVYTFNDAHHSAQCNCSDGLPDPGHTSASSPKPFMNYRLRPRCAAFWAFCHSVKNTAWRALTMHAPPLWNYSVWFDPITKVSDSPGLPNSSQR